MSFSKLFLATALGQSSPMSERRVALDTIDSLGISTVYTDDQGYETALGDTKGHWHPVERYPSKEAAATGHAEWVKRIRAGERQFTELGYDEVRDPEPLNLS